MSQRKIALLQDRGVVRVDGSDAEKFLQGVLTNDVDLLAGLGGIYAALLTPQGKILFDFFVVRSKHGFLLETARDQIPGLIKRLGMYRLRAKVEIENVSDEWDAWATWGGDAVEPPWMSEGVSPNDDLEPVGMGFMDGRDFLDPRLQGMGKRWVVYRSLRTQLRRLASQEGDILSEEEQYHAHRIALGVPEGGKDYAFGDVFPHEANVDLLNGVSFTKGCFVGQEVVSRMQHRGTARKRIVIIEGDAPLSSGAQITAGTATIGTVGSVAGNRGLALVRLDRAEEAKTKGEDLATGGTKIIVRPPDYMKQAAPADTP